MGVGLCQLMFELACPLVFEFVSELVTKFAG